MHGSRALAIRHGQTVLVSLLISVLTLVLNQHFASCDDLLQQTNRLPRAVVPFGWSPRNIYPIQYYRPPYAVPVAHFPIPVAPKPRQRYYGRRPYVNINTVDTRHTQNSLEDQNHFEKTTPETTKKVEEPIEIKKPSDLKIPLGLPARRPSSEHNPIPKQNGHHVPESVQYPSHHPPVHHYPVHHEIHPPSISYGAGYSPSFDTMEFKPSNFPEQLKERERKINNIEVEKKVEPPRKVQITEMPKTSASNIERMLTTVFNTPRSDETNSTAKNEIRGYIYEQFQTMGFESFLHNFTEFDKNETDGSDIEIEGSNIVAVIPGDNAGSPQDAILLVGAHYDTFKDSPGVNDNGSGMTVMMEIMRNLMARKCRFQNSVMFVAFDQEEMGGLGSFHFVNEYLIPMVLQSGRGTFQGAFILDTILNYNATNKSQDMPEDIQEAVPSVNNYVQDHGNTGNFLSLMSRYAIDSNLTSSLKKAWSSLDKPEYMLHDMPVDLGRVIPPMDVLQKRMNFVRSDHAMFWYHNNTDSYPRTLKSILITDTGPFRGRMRECYHTECDDVSFVTPENINLAKKLGDSLIMSLLDLGNGSCSNQEYLASTYNEGSSLTLTIAACLLAAFLLLFSHDTRI